VNLKNLLKSVAHNVGVTVVSFAFAGVGFLFDRLLGITAILAAAATVAGAVLVALGFALRVWAIYDFYERRMKVISLVPQKSLITTGPYRISRNPLYLGGNVFMFLGAALILGTTMGLILTVAHWVPMDLMVRREERQLAKEFGDEWTSYRNQVRRWI
jgi:protein-S-isoprenylcysteine O-methyltransferase Ste14